MYASIVFRVQVCTFHEGMKAYYVCGFMCTNSIQSASLHILKCSQEVYVQQTGVYEQLYSAPMPCTLCGEPGNFMHQFFVVSVPLKNR